MWEGGKEKKRLPRKRQPFCSSLQFTVFGGGWILICCALAHCSFLQSLCLNRQSDCRKELCASAQQIKIQPPPKTVNCRELQNGCLFRGSRFFSFPPSHIQT